MISLIFTAIFSYGFLITHQTVGIDDTPYALYFEEGLATIVGRWVLFLINKVFHISDFAPFVTDLAGVLIFMAGVTVWCVLFKRMLGEKVPMYGYVLFSCLFLSNPLISEVYTYYLHNGVAIGYLCSGLSLCFLWESLDGRAAENGHSWKKKLPLWLGSAVGLLVAMGCYESFMIVYLVGVCIILWVARVEGRLTPVWRNLVIAAVIAVAGIIMRSMVIVTVTKLFGLDYLKEDAVQRSITEMAGWILQPGALSEFAMLVKRILVMYGVFAYAYYPIFVYVIAVAAVLILGVVFTIRRKDPWIILLTLGSLGASYLLVIVEGKATYYRSAQFLPLFCAWGLLMVVYSLNQLFQNKVKLSGISNRVLCALLCVILWNQCTDMNKWFYVDWMKYEDAKDTAGRIAYELEKNFDTSKPVYFAGVHMVPKSIIKDAYVDYGSETYFKMLNLSSIFDPHILEKFHREYGVWIAQTPSLSVIDWGRWAFDNNEELIRFFSMHGHELVPLLDEEIYPQLEEEAADMPHFPQEGSIVDKGEYIVVHF